MEPLCIFILFGLLTGFGVAQNVTSPSYLISVSREIRSEVPVRVSVTILTESPVLVISEIVQSNASLSRAQSTIAGGSTDLQVLPAISENNMTSSYPLKLIVKGYKGDSVVFSNSTDLQYDPQSVSILLQTDKPRYKPGQSVKIRALIINPEGKPRSKAINITILDPDNNKIHQWLDANTTLGVATKEFQLSQHPSLGLWSIQAQVNEVHQGITFNVSHYVLPKFEVLLDAPAVLYYEDLLNYTVTAQYLFGKPVAGKLAVSYLGINGEKQLYENETMINGKADLSSNVSALYPWFEYYYTKYLYIIQEYIDIQVQVTELLTGVTYNNSVRVSIARQRYKLEFQQYPTTLKPSLNFSAQFKISTYNNQPLTTEDQSYNVTLVVSQESLWNWGWGEEANLETMENVSLQAEFVKSIYPYVQPNTPVKTLQFPLPADGIIPFQFELTQNVSTLNIEAQYKNLSTNLNLYKGYSPTSESYIQLRRTNSPQVGQPLLMTVESNFPLAKFYYMVLARGQLVDVGTLTSSSFSLSPDVFWAPVARILVYCFSLDGGIVNDFLEVSFTQVLRNNVSLSWKKEQVEPEEHITLSVSVAEPGSLVGIVVVDKATQDSETVNDITEKRVLEELALYSPDKTYWAGSGSSSPYSVFMECGVTVLTDANLNEISYLVYSVFADAFRPEQTSVQIEQKEPRQRWNFPETWLWLDTLMGESTTNLLALTVPDSMTSWVAKAFVISENLGLGISTPVELRVSQDFFITVNLPAYIIRGEQLLLEVSLFNYMDVDIEVLVTFDKNDMFEFVTPGDVASLQAATSQVTVLKQNTALVSFAIKAIKLGEMPISVKAMSFSASDWVYHTILVKAEGREESFTQTLFLEFAPMTTSLSRQLEFHFPAATVPGSLSAQLSAVGDILGPSISGLNSLIQMPSGCGEQNMINFAPNIYVLRYLSSTGHVDQETCTKALNYMKQGYEQELTYQRQDGSFSAFGQSDTSGSTWLSAFVMRCFLQARDFLSINTEVLIRTADWLKKQQGADGSFMEPGRVIHTELQGGQDGPLSLTAYVLMALLEDEQYGNSKAVSAALDYLTSKLDEGISSNYSLCLVTYALSLANSSSASRALTELMNRARMQDGVPMWSSGADGVSNSWQPRSTDIEMVSYVLLSIHKQGDVEQGLTLMKWLSQQRNHLGGYGSTQDTVIALHALSAFASLSGTNQIDLKITVNTSTATVATFTIDQTNYMLYQSRQFAPENHLQLQISAVGRGFALVQLTTFYNIQTQELSRRRRDTHICEGFNLNIDVTDRDMYSVNIHICFRLCDNVELSQTGMAIVDVGLLTGFNLAQSGVPINDLVRNVETPAGHVILYLDSVNKTEVCIDVPTTMEVKVAGVQDAVVMLYDYYEPRRMTQMRFTSESRRSASVCSFCEEGCSQCKGQDISVFDSVISSHQYQTLVLSLALAIPISLVLWF